MGRIQVLSGGFFLLLLKKPLLQIVQKNVPVGQLPEAGADENRQQAAPKETADADRERNALDPVYFLLLLSGRWIANRSCGLRAIFTALIISWFGRMKRCDHSTWWCSARGPPA